MNFLFGLPLALRLAGVFVVGLATAGFLNLAVYRWAWNARPISPWSSADGLSRRWTDRLPIIGWLFLRREAHLHGAGFWLRPLLVELGFASALAGLYWWETVAFASLPPRTQGPAPPGHFVTTNLVWFAHLQFLSHGLLLALMIVASLIDLDEKTIPDLLTVPGTVLGLALAVTIWCLPASQEWISGPAARPIREIDLLTITSPGEWIPPLHSGTASSLALSLVCWLGWCFALLPRRWRARKGHARAAAIFLRRLQREPWSVVVAAIAAIGTLLLTLAWWKFSPPAWAALLTSLVGLAAGGGSIWFVRLVGTGMLGKEAMGFGDVTLMAMIGAFVGWQPCLFIFFVAPFAGLLLGILQLLLRGGSEIPYGPFLCLATCLVVLLWPALWNWGLPLFEVGWLVPTMMLICAVLLAVLLGLLRLVRRLLGAG